MRKDKNIAIKMRKDGRSYNYICRHLNIPKSTLATWFKNKKWSSVICKHLTSRNNLNSQIRIRKWAEINKIRWEKWRLAARNEAKKSFFGLCKNSLFVAGIMLYWGEGDSKIKNPIRLANTDPRMILIFINFLFKICNVSKEKLRLSLVLYPDLLDEKCKLFWSKACGISIAKFLKTQYIRGYHPTKRLEYGICTVIVNSRQLKEKIIVWIDMFSKMYNN
jgi:hypothetical protein